MVLVSSVTRDRHQSTPQKSRVLTHACCHFKSIHSRKTNIEQQDVWYRSFCHFKGRGTVMSYGHFVPEKAKEERQSLRRVHVVIHHKYSPSRCLVVTSFLFLFSLWCRQFLQRGQTQLKLAAAAWSTASSLYHSSMQLYQTSDERQTQAESSPRGPVNGLLVRTDRIRAVAMPVQCRHRHLEP